MAVSAAISVFSVWIGLAAAAMFNVPPSFLIVTVACGIWLAVWLTDRNGRSAAAVLDRTTRPSIVPAGPTASALVRTPAS
jgi:zinc/manganese transport system permease protein